MHRLILFLLLIPILVSKIQSQDTLSGTSGLYILDSKPPVVEIISPDGGESYNFLGNIQVTYIASDDFLAQAPISIGFCVNPGGAFSMAASGLENTGSTIVQTPGVVSDYAKARVIAVDPFGNKGIDDSDGYFSFLPSFSSLSGSYTLDSKPPEVALVAPNGGEIHYYSEPLLVQWSAEDDSFGPESIDIFLSVDSGINYTPVITGLPDIDTASIQTPETISDVAKIKIRAKDTFGLTGEDESDGVFSLYGYQVDLKTFLEGPFTGVEMIPYLNQSGYLPLSHPYSSSPWNYEGSESVSGIPGTDIIDWVLIELRDASSASLANTASRIARKAGFILKNGMVRATDGSQLLKFGSKIDHNLYAVIWHRNHIGIMSANPLNLTGNTYSYDFTTQSTQVYGSFLACKQLVPGTWGMIAGDGDADNQVNNSDKTNIWMTQSGSSGYKAGDFSLNGQVDNNDKAMWRPNVGKSAQVPQ